MAQMVTCFSGKPEGMSSNPQLHDSSVGEVEMGEIPIVLCHANPNGLGSSRPTRDPASTNELDVSPDKQHLRLTLTSTNTQEYAHISWWEEHHVLFTAEPMPQPLWYTFWFKKKISDKQNSNLVWEEVWCLAVVVVSFQDPVVLWWNLNSHTYGFRGCDGDQENTLSQKI